MTDHNNELAGRAAIVTGSARNIGRAIALDLADGGASVLINGRTSRDEAEATADDVDPTDDEGAATADEDLDESEETSP